MDLWSIPRDPKPGEEESEEEERRRRSRGRGVVGGEVVDLPALPASAAQHRLDSIEDSSFQTLPTEVSLALAESRMRRRDLRRAAALLARETDLEPDWVFDRADVTPLIRYRDPTYSRLTPEEREALGDQQEAYLKHRTMSLQTARRLIKPHEPKIIRAILKRWEGVEDKTVIALEANGVPRRRHYEGRAEVKPGRIAEVMVALTELPGEQVSFTDALGVAVQVARGETDLEAFRSNLAHSIRVPGIDSFQAAGVAFVATEEGLRFRDTQQAALFAAPPVARKAISEAEREAEARAQAIRLHAGESEGEMPPEVAADPALAEAWRKHQAALRPEEIIKTETEIADIESDPFALAEKGRKLQGEIDDVAGDFVEAADKIAADITLERDAMKNTAAYKTMSFIGGQAEKVFGGAEWLWRKGQAKLAQAGAWGAFPFRIVFQGGEKAREIREEHLEWSRDISDGDTTLGHGIAGALHAPSWSAPIIDLAIGFAADPFIVGGRVLRGVKHTRMLTRTTPAVYGGRGLDHISLNRRHAGLGNKSVPDFILDSIDASEDGARFFDDVASRFRGTSKRPGMDPQLAEALWQVSRANTSLGRTARLQQIQAVISHAHGLRATGVVPTIDEMIQAVRRRHRDLPEQLQLMDEPASQLGAELGGPASKAAAELDRIVGVLDDVRLRMPAPVSLEIPRVPITAALQQRVSRALGSTPLGRSAETLFNTSPSLVANLERDPVGYVRRLGRRARVFKRDEVRLYERKMATVNRLPPGEREGAFVAVLQRMEKDYIEGIARQKGLIPEAAVIERRAAQLAKNEKAKLTKRGRKLRPETVEKIEAAARETAEAELIGKQVRELVKLARSGSRRFNTEMYQTYGVNMKFDDQGFFTGYTSTRPLVETQLLNEWAMIDPLIVRKAINEAATTASRFRRGFASVVGREAQLTMKPNLDKVFEVIGHRTLRDSFLRYWKPAVVVRPAYLLRIPLGEEQLRYLADLGVIARLEATKSGARVVRGLRRMIGKSGDETISVRLSRDGETQIVDIEVTAPGFLPDNPNANSNASYQTIVEGMTDESKRILTQLQSSGRWVPVTKEASNFYHAWAWDLGKQFGKSEIGRRVLRGLQRGAAHDDIVNEVAAFLSHDRAGRRVRKALDIVDTAEDIALHADRVTDVITGYVGGRHALTGRVAQAALDDADNLLDIVRSIDDAGHAPASVHGPEIFLAGSKSHPLMRAWDRYQKFILQDVTNKVSRQPYAKAWERDAFRGMMRLASEQGLTLTDDMVRAFGEQAKKFAGERAQQIMFDLSRQSRFGEMLGFTAPFFQPYTEAFTVWSRLVRENPALIGIARQLGEATKEILPTDPDTGERLIPLSWFMRGDSLLRMAFGSDGWALAAPLTSFNLFFQSAMNIPTGAFAGDVPIPVPGFSPPVQWVAQQMVSGTGPLGGTVGKVLPESFRAWATSWLFEFGPVDATSVLPTYLQHFVRGVAPGLNENYTRLMEKSFMRMYEAEGRLDPDENTPPPGWTLERWQAISAEDRGKHWRRHIAEMARGDAGNLSLMRTFFALVFPAAPRVQFPTAELEREWRDLTAQYEGDFEKALDTFLDRHEDNILITIPKTIWSGYAEGEGLLGGTPALPANEMVERLLASPGARDFARQYPRWVWGMIPKEIREADFDIGAYFAQIARGDRGVPSGEEFLTERDRRMGWEAWFIENERWLARQERLSQKSISQESPVFDRYSIAHEEVVQGIKDTFPGFAADLRTFENTGDVNATVIDDLRDITENSPLWRETEAGQGAQAYLQLRRETIAKMRENGIGNITTIAAETVGIKEAWDKGVEGILEAFPDFATLHRLYFQGDLQGVATKAERTIKNIPSEVFDKRIKPWWREWEQAKDRPFDADNPAAVSEAYDAQRQLINRAFEDFPAKWNPLRLWFEGLSETDRYEYKLSAAVRPYIFLSETDRRLLLGEKTSKAAEKKWAFISEARVLIDRKRYQDPEWYSGDSYQRLDGEIRKMMAGDEVFAAQVRHANRWGYGLEKILRAGPVDGSESFLREGSPSKPAWEALFDTVGKVQSEADRLELRGDDDAAYVRLRKFVLWYADELKTEHAQFRREWEELERRNGPDLLSEYLVPPIYFPLGGSR